MINFLSLLKAEFRQVTDESYLDTNTKKVITYPYLTYQVSDEAIARNVDGFYIDVDIFDKSKSYVNLYSLEGLVKAHFKGLDVLTDDMFLRFSYRVGNRVDTGDDLLIRRNIQLYCKVEWRNK